MIAWRDLPGLRDPDRFDAWLRRLLVRSCVAEAKRERRIGATIRVLPIDIPGPRTTTSASPTETSWIAASAACHLSSAPSSCCATSPDWRWRRSPRPWRSRPARSGPDSTTPIARCAPHSMPTPARPRSEGDPHDGRARHGAHPRALARRRHRRDARPGLPLHRRSRGAPAPAARVARLLEGLHRERLPQADPRHRGGHRPRRRRHRRHRSAVRVGRRRRRANRIADAIAVTHAIAAGPARWDLESR